MLVKGYNVNLSIFYWLLFIPIFLGISYKALFFEWQIQKYYFNELEDFGRYLFVLAISFIEAFIYVLIIRFIVFLFQKHLHLNKWIVFENKISNTINRVINDIHKRMQGRRDILFVFSCAKIDGSLNINIFYKDSGYLLPLNKAWSCYGRS